MQRVLLGLLALALLLAGTIVFSIDQIAGRRAERSAREALGVGVDLGFLHLSLLAGEVRVGGLEISNPPGFAGEHFLTLDEITLATKLGSLRSEVVQVPLFSLAGVDVSLEREEKHSNTDVILANLKRFEATGAASGEPRPKGPERRYAVSKLVIRDVTAHVEWSEYAARASAVDVKLERIELSHPGGERGLTLPELSNVVVKAVLDGVRESGQLPAEVALNLAGGLGGLAKLPIVVTGGVLTGAGGLIGGDAGEVLEAAGEAVQDVGAAAERGVKGAFDKLSGK